MINENETINLSQFSVRETKGFWGRSLDLEKKAEIANEKVARASSSIFFGVRHYTKEKKIRVNVSGFCKIGSVLYGANFDKDFTTEKQKVLATHILLDCLHGNVTQINKQALKNFVLKRSAEKEKKASGNVSSHGVELKEEKIDDSNLCKNSIINFKKKNTRYVTEEPKLAQAEQFDVHIDQGMSVESKNHPNEDVPENLASTGEDQSGLDVEEESLPEIFDENILAVPEQEELLQHRIYALNDWRFSETFVPESIDDAYARATVEGLCEPLDDETLSGLAMQLKCGIARADEKDRSLLTNIALVIANTNPQHPSLDSYKDFFLHRQYQDDFTQQEKLFLATMSKAHGFLNGEWIEPILKRRTGDEVHECLGNPEKTRKLLLGIENFKEQFEGDPFLEVALTHVRERLEEKLRVEITLPENSGMPIHCINGECLTYKKFFMLGDSWKKEIRHDSASFLVGDGASHVQKEIQAIISLLDQEAISDTCLFPASAPQVPVDVVSQANFEAVSLKCADIEGSLADRTSLSHEERLEFLKKSEEALSALCAHMGYGRATDNVADSLCAYVQREGRLPKALQKVFESDRHKEQLRLLSTLLYYNAALKNERQLSFLPIATVQDFSWLFTKDGANRCFSLLKALHDDPKFCGCTCTKQQAAWGMEVASLLKGELSNPIYGPGGSGKTVSVKLFVSFLPKCGIGADDQKIVMFAPFADRDADDVVQSKMLSEISGKVVVDVDVDPEKAVVIVDEAHLLQPDFELVLRRGSVSRSVGSKFLRMTATPITAPLRSKEVNQAILETFRKEEAFCIRKKMGLDSIEQRICDQIKEQIKKKVEGFFNATRVKALQDLENIPQLQAGMHYYSNCFERLFGDRQDPPTVLEAFQGFLGGTAQRPNGFLDNVLVQARLKNPKLQKKYFQLYAAIRVGGYQDEYNQEFNTHLKSSEASKEMKLVHDQRQKLDVVLAKIQANIKQLERLVSPEGASQEEKERVVYLETARMRKICFDSIEIDVGNEMIVGEEVRPSCDQIASSVRSLCADASRIQVVLPFLKINQSYLTSFHHSLQGQFPEKNVCIVYRDSHSASGSEWRGRDCVLRKDSVERLGSWIPGKDDVVVMVYDATNKQGGDFGSLSRNPDMASTQQPHIEQIVFLNYGERADSMAALTESDMYQALHRRRGSEEVGPKRHVVTSLSREKLLEKIGTNQGIFEQQWAVKNAVDRVARLVMAVKVEPEKKRPVVTKGGLSLQLKATTTHIQAVAERAMVPCGQMKQEITRKGSALRAKIMAEITEDPLQMNVKELQEEAFWESYRALVEAEKIVEVAHL